MNEHLTGIPKNISGLNFRLWITYETEASQPELYIIRDGKVVFSISINEQIRIFREEDFPVDSGEVEDIKKFIKTNRETLIHFYYHSIENDFCEVEDFYKKLKGVK